MQADLKKALEVLRTGGTILYPTDTIWGIGCDATNAKAIAKVQKIKFRTPQKSLIILANTIEMVNFYVEKIPDIAVDLIQSYKEPLTIVFDKARNLPRNLVSDDGSIAIRIPRYDFCQELISQLGKPITSTSANISGEPAAHSFNKINLTVKDAVDYICTTDQQVVNAPKPSTIIRVYESGHMQIIRS
jgi:L-threonylcarbamoyladenylate synthase